MEIVANPECQWERSVRREKNDDSGVSGIATYIQQVGNMFQQIEKTGFVVREWFVNKQEITVPGLSVRFIDPFIYPTAIIACTSTVDSAPDCYTIYARRPSLLLVRPVRVYITAILNTIARIENGSKVDSAPAGSSKQGYTTNYEEFTEGSLLHKYSLRDCMEINQWLGEELSVDEMFSKEHPEDKNKLQQELMKDITLSDLAMIGKVFVGCAVVHAARIVVGCVAHVQRVGMSSCGKVDTTPTGSSMKSIPTHFGSRMEIFLRSECSTDDVSFVSENGDLQKFLMKAPKTPNIQLWYMYHGVLGVTMKKGERPELENFINYSSKPERHSGSSQDDDAIFPENDRLLCKVCYMNELSIVFLPCSHMVACRRCAARLKTCPVCRSGIKEALPANLHE